MLRLPSAQRMLPVTSRGGQFNTGGLSRPLLSKLPVSPRWSGCVRGRKCILTDACYNAGRDTKAEELIARVETWPDGARARAMTPVTISRSCSGGRNGRAVRQELEPRRTGAPGRSPFAVRRRPAARLRQRSVARRAPAGVPHRHRLQSSRSPSTAAWTSAAATIAAPRSPGCRRRCCRALVLRAADRIRLAADRPRRPQQHLRPRPHRQSGDGRRRPLQFPGPPDRALWRARPRRADPGRARLLRRALGGRRMRPRGGRAG